MNRNMVAGNRGVIPPSGMATKAYLQANLAKYPGLAHFFAFDEIGGVPTCLVTGMQLTNTIVDSVSGGIATLSGTKTGLATKRWTPSQSKKILTLTIGTITNATSAGVVIGDVATGGAGFNSKLGTTGPTLRVQPSNTTYTALSTAIASMGTSYPGAVAITLEAANPGYKLHKIMSSAGAPITAAVGSSLDCTGLTGVPEYPITAWGSASKDYTISTLNPAIFAVFYLDTLPTAAEIAQFTAWMYHNTLVDSAHNKGMWPGMAYRT